MGKFLVTGCAGLIGSHLSTYLINEGHTVIGIDDLSGGYEDWLPNNELFKFFKINLTNAEYLETIFRSHDFDAVYHLAAYAAEGLSPFIRVHNYMNNVIASANIINKCVEFECKLIFASSMAVYGRQQPPFNESMLKDPIDPYGNAKATVENDIAMASDQFGLRYSIIRPHNVIGTQQNIWDKYRNVLGIFIRRTINGEPMQIYGNGDQTRAFSDIKFYMEPLSCLKDNFDREVFNIGSDRHLTINELARIVSEESLKIGLTPRIEHLEPRHEALNAYCDHRKAKDLLNFVDQTDVREITNQMLVWAMNQPSRKVSAMRYEITKGLYSYWK